ncbi:protein translocase subunit SecD [Georgenia halophila]|uniref:protein translocase subunit SecD n=1 Tax=Georgenia halophila TaxID=620889 RepID=UPI0031EFCFCF
MAPRPRRERPGRTLGLLGLIVVALFGSLFAGSQLTDDASLTPELALDLEGGTQLVLTPQTTDGSEITTEDINQAIAIIRQRVDASGVAEAEITRQGSANIVVGLPGTPDNETIELVGRSAQLRFRPVLTVGGPGTIDPEALQEQQQAQENPDAEQTEEPTEEETQGPPPTQEEIEAAARQAADSDGNGELSDQPATEPANSSDPAWITEQLTYEYFTLDCSDPANRIGGTIQARPGEPLVTCSEDGTAKFILGPTSLTGSHLDSASSGMQVNSQGISTGQWAVNLELNNEGTEIFGTFSERLFNLQPPRNQFAIVLDGLVISNASMNAPIFNGEAQITGSFTSESAATLANQLNFGSLPIDFEIQSQEQISATLGTEQLSKGILAGLIGAGLVVLYMLWQYRGLGMVSVASLVLAGAITYGTIALMSWLIGYRLSLPGVVGLIVAVGITADSFIVYFERIRDEVREGRTLAAAIAHGWPRARRTILASDAVNFTAAAVLYLLAVGGVQGFAFTLGLVTIVDIVVVFLFTHPVLLLLVKTKFFGEGHKLSGLEPESLGATSATYRGRGQFRTPRPIREPAGAPVKEPELVGARASAGAATSSAGPRSREPDDTVAADETAATDAEAATDERATGHGAPTESTPEREPLPPPVDEDGRRLTIAERRALQRRRQAEHDRQAERPGQADQTDPSEHAEPDDKAEPDQKVEPGDDQAGSDRSGTTDEDGER